MNRLNIARNEALAELAKPKTEWPDFDPDEKAAIDTLCTLSGSLIMASAHARRLINDTAMYNLREADEAEVDRLLSDYIQKVRDQHITTEETDKFLEDVYIPASADDNPSRARRVKFAVVGSLLALSAAGAVIIGATAPASVLIGVGAASFLPAIFSKKAIENDPDFKALVEGGGETLQRASEATSEGSHTLVKKLGDVFKHRKEQIQRLSAMVSEFRWLEPILERLGISDEIVGDPARSKTTALVSLLPPFEKDKVEV